MKADKPEKLFDTIKTSPVNGCSVSPEKTGIAPTLANSQIKIKVKNKIKAMKVKEIFETYFKKE